MKQIECYKTSDGRLFEDEDRAQSHEDDLIGEELDEFIRLHFDLDSRRSDIYRGLLKVLKNKQALASTCRKILSIIDYTGE
jgi:hypothetical protein